MKKASKRNKTTWAEYEAAGSDFRALKATLEVSSNRFCRFLSSESSFEQAVDFVCSFEDIVDCSKLRFRSKLLSMTFVDSSDPVFGKSSELGAEEVG